MFSECFPNSELPEEGDSILGRNCQELEAFLKGLSNQEAGRSRGHRSVARGQGFNDNPGSPEWSNLIC